MQNKYRLRRAVQSDSLTIAEHRGWMFCDMGDVAQDDVASLTAVVEPWMRELLAKGEYVGWLISCDEGIVAGAGVHLRVLGPGPGSFKVGRWAHIANVYTVPAHRRCGLARRLMQEILDWCAAEAIDQITLSASIEGRPLYRSLGFTETSDMRWVAVAT